MVVSCWRKRLTDEIGNKGRGYHYHQLEETNDSFRRPGSVFGSVHNFLADNKR